VQDSSAQASAGNPTAADQARRVLNVGCGPKTSRRLQPFFAPDAWQEIRLDIEPRVQPDIVGSVTQVAALVQPASVDAVWASHVMEHLFRHEVLPTLRQIRSVLKPTGFAIISSPDIESAARLVADHGIDHVAYTSPAGPITAHDMFYGLSSAIAGGHTAMAHRTAFTGNSLGELLLDAGFPVVLVKAEQFNLWAVALMQQADRAAIEQQLASAGLNMAGGAE
jgi:hypothetical protein